MSMFIATDSLVRDRQLRVIHLEIPFTIVGNASSSSVVVTTEDPAILLIKTAGVDQITPAVAIDSTPPTFASPNDATGLFNAALTVRESVAEVVCAFFVSSNTSVTTVISASLANGNTGIDQSGTIICLNVPSGLALNTTNTLQGALCVSYEQSGSGEL